MPNPWIDQQQIQDKLAKFFETEKRVIAVFGNTVNQTFEAFVFASAIAWYKKHGWAVEFANPVEDQITKKKQVRLKFSTRGRPDNYTYAICRKNGIEIHVRHQLRVATRFHKEGQSPPANVCLDLAIIQSIDLSMFDTHMHVPNSALISFGEAKHMSAFAELIAGFVGLVHEMQPDRLKRVRIGKWKQAKKNQPSAFLYVSGVLYRTAEGIEETIRRRKYDIDIFTKTKALADSFELPGKSALKKSKTNNRAKKKKNTKLKRPKT